MSRTDVSGNYVSELFSDRDYLSFFLLLVTITKLPLFFSILGNLDINRVIFTKIKYYRTLRLRWVDTPGPS